MVDPKILASFHRLVGSFGGQEALPAGGAAAVASIAMGAALGAKVARMSPGHEHNEKIGNELQSLTGRVTAEFEADCAAFEGLLGAFRTPKDDAGRAQAIRDGWLSATRAPVLVARLADDADRLLARLAGSVKPDLRGDLGAARVLVQAGRRIAVDNANENAEHLERSLAETVLAGLPADAAKPSR